MNQPQQLDLPKDLGSIKLQIDSIMVSVNDKYTSLIKASMQLQEENKKLKNEVTMLKTELENKSHG